MAAWRETARELPVVEEADVVVCGGGPAGVAAAIAAGRQGARVRLIEAHGCLGGIWTAGLLSWILDSGGKTGLMPELLERLEQRGARPPQQWKAFAYSPEGMKLLLDDLCAEAGVGVRQHTRVCAAGRAPDNRLAVAITESKSGREAWAGKVFIDCTGDGDLAAQAGCGFDLGRPGTAETQPLSLMALLGGLRYEEVRPFVHEDQGGPREDTRRLLAAIQAGGFDPTYHSPILIRISDQLYAMMANHQYGVSAMDAQQISDATVRARGEVAAIVAALRSQGGCWRELQTVATAAQIGVREGRRIRGRYQVTAADLAAGARFEDAVCRVTFSVDVHATSANSNKTYSNEGVKAKPYDLPLRALIARDVDGLMMAGRCISGDFLAHASYRVTGNAVQMGEAAGLCAALAARRDCLPQEVPFGELVQVAAGTGLELGAALTARHG